MARPMSTGPNGPLARPTGSAARPQLPGIARPRLPGVGFHPENLIAGPAPKVCQRRRPRSIADRVFFHHSQALPSILARAQDCHTQSWRGHRIATLNPGMGTGLPHSILARAQDCPGVAQYGLAQRLARLPTSLYTEVGIPTSVFCRKTHHRASAEGPGVMLCSQRNSRSVFPPFTRPAVNPGVGTGLPRCFPENAGSAVLYSTTPPDSPPGLRGKHRQCVGTHRCTPGLAARIARKTPAASCCVAVR